MPDDKIESEEEWEARIVRETLGDALKPDGSIDFDKLLARGEIMTLEELYPDGGNTDYETESSP